MQKELLQLITRSTPKDFFDSIREKMPQAIRLAYNDSERYPEEERGRMLGISKHQRLNGAFREAALLSGLNFAEGEKFNTGECYIATTPYIVFGKANLRPHNRVPARALYREEIAMINGPLEPETLDLFNPNPTQPSLERLGCLILPVISKDNREKTLAGIYVGVPYTNQKDWHMYESLDTVIAAYNSPSESEGLTDQAFASLKKTLKKKEG